MLTLYFCPGLCSLASHITIEETGTPYTEKVVNVMKGEHMGGDYLKVNPQAAGETIHGEKVVASL
ncbi:MAG TPA: hypothetical protein VGL83_07770, partial [Stellaceae bacterium]